MNEIPQPPWSDDQLTRMRKQSVKLIRSMGFKEDITFTCDDCPDKHDCDFSMDPYNTDDDCLMEK